MELTREEILEKRVAELEERLASANSLASEMPLLHVDDIDTSALIQELIEKTPEFVLLKPLLEDDAVNDVLINGARNIYVERSNGKLELTDISLPNEEVVSNIAHVIVESVGRTLDLRRPVVDARLKDGSRVNIIAPPMAVDGTTISIRKFAKRTITLDKMKEQQNVSDGLGEFLKVCGASRLNVIISGGTGSGKTTMLNAISQFINAKERIVTIEDAAELRLEQPHVVRLETKPAPNAMLLHEEVSIRDLVKNTLRMRPDRIIVGEVRDAAAFDMMQAMNTGHEGSLTTIHANHPRDALDRLENMINMADLNLPSKAIRNQIASAIHLIIQVSRMRDGKRRVTYVSEIVGMEGEVITMQDLFIFKVKGDNADGSIDGSFEWTGIMPRFLRRAGYYGELERLESSLGVKLGL